MKFQTLQTFMAWGRIVCLGVLISSTASLVSRANGAVVSGGIPDPSNSNLVFWLRADAGVNTTGSLVDSWVDQATILGGSNNASAAGSNRPTLVPNAINGNPAIQFDGIDDILTIPDNNALDLGTGAGKGWTLFLVYKDPATGQQQELINKGGVGSANTDWRFFVESSKVYWGTGSSADLNGAWMSVAEPVAAQAHTLTGELSQTGATTGTKNFYIDSVGAASSAYTQKAAAGVESVVIGATTASTLQFNGQIAEILAYNTKLSGFDRALVERYLAGKYAPVAAPTVLAYWTFEEKTSGAASATAGAILDASGNNRHATAIGTPLPTYVASPNGSALRFTAGDDQLKIYDTATSGEPADAFDFGASDSFTVEAMIRVDSSFTGVGNIIGKDWGGNLPSWWFRINGGKLQAIVDDTDGGNLNGLVTGITNINDGKWHHVAFVRNAARDVVSLYIDYAPDATATDFTSNTLMNDQNLAFGGFNAASDREFVGDIDYVRISAGALPTFQFVGVPEPASWILLGVGMSVLSRRGRLFDRSRGPLNN